MAFAPEPGDLAALSDRICSATCITPPLLTEVIALACRRIASAPQGARTVRIRGLIDAQAWTDMALALIDLELPQWQVRRIAYDGGDWHCALSRQRELPDWLDQSVEFWHNDLSMAMLGAFVEARIAVAQLGRPSVPSVPRTATLLCAPVCCDNFA
jgi:hypothetical protein